MRLKALHFFICCTLALAFGCTQENLITRDIFTGDYAVTEARAGQTISYEVTITVAPNSENGLLLQNFGNLGQEVELRAQARGYSLEIDPQFVALDAGPSKLIQEEWCFATTTIDNDGTIVLPYAPMGTPSEDFREAVLRKVR